MLPLWGALEQVQVKCHGLRIPGDIQPEAERIPKHPAGPKSCYFDDILVM